MSDPTPTIVTPPAPVAAATVPAAPLKRRLMERQAAVASFKYNTWAVDLDEAQSLDDVMDSHFWASIAEKIMGQDKTAPKGWGDLIQIRKRDTEQFLEVMVVSIGKGFVKVVPLRGYEPKAVSEPETAPLTTRWNPGKKCREVIRKSDKMLMASNFQTQEEAVAWIADHMKAMAA